MRGARGRSSVPTGAGPPGRRARPQRRNDRTLLPHGGQLDNPDTVGEAPEAIARQSHRQAGLADSSGPNQCHQSAGVEEGPSQAQVRFPPDQGRQLDGNALDLDRDRRAAAGSGAARSLAASGG
jgi:hypothetical protein